MNPLNQINIEEKSTIYDVTLTYHSDMKCQNYDAKITCTAESNGRVTIESDKDHTFFSRDFTFHNSDPDRVIAIAQMIMAFAQMVKNNNAKKLDVSENE